MGKLVTGIVDDNAIASIYRDYEPAFNNLYTVEIFSTSFLNEDVYDDDMNDYVKYHAIDVKFDDETLNLERNSVTKNFQLTQSDQYTWANSLKITWRESDDWKVKMYHENWVKKFYNKEEDCFMSHELDDSVRLTKTIKIHLPYTKKSEQEYEERTVVFYNVLPRDIGSFNFNWGTSGEIITHSLSYYVKSWEWETENVILASNSKDKK